MSAAAATADAATPPAKKGKKKLFLILGLVLVLLLGGGAAAFFLLKPQAEPELDEYGEPIEQAEPAHPAKKAEAGVPPAFLPLDPFVVNLADRESERYAQIGITLQVDDAKVAEQLKTYMPAIRNGVIMILAHKTADELLSREGKEKLAAEIRRESVRPLGIEIEDEEDEAAESDPPPKKRKKRKPAVHVPVEQVHFSSFIIQ